jgi:hypothetical protein
MEHWLESKIAEEVALLEEMREPIDWNKRIERMERHEKFQ